MNKTRKKKILGAAAAAREGIKIADTVAGLKAPLENLVEALRPMQNEMQDSVDKIEARCPEGTTVSDNLSSDIDWLGDILDDLEGWDPEEPFLDAIEMTPDNFREWQEEQKEEVLNLVAALDAVVDV